MYLWACKISKLPGETSQTPPAGGKHPPHYIPTLSCLTHASATLHLPPAIFLQEALCANLAPGDKWSEEFIYKLKTPSLKQIFSYFRKGMQHKFIVFQSRQLSKELHCFGYHFVKQKAVCIINVCGYMEILPCALPQTMCSSVCEMSV